MKILYIVSTLQRSGPINVLYNITRDLDVNDYVILTLSPEESEKSMKSDFEKLGSQIIALNLTRMVRKKQVLNNIKEVISSNNIEIIHSHGLRADYYASKIKEVAHFSTIHNYPYEDYPKIYGKVLGTFIAQAHMKIIKRINYPIACSYAIQKKFKRKKIELEVVQNGVDTKRFFRVTPDMKRQIREKLNLPTNHIILISTGMLIKRKRPIELVRGFNKFLLENQINDCTLMVLGSGNLEEQVQKEIKENVILLGNKKEVETYLQASDIFISNSSSEGLPMAALEALVTGLSTVLSDIDSHRELKLKSDEISLFKNDIEDMMEKIKIEYFKIKNNKQSREINMDFSSQIMSSSYLQKYKISQRRDN
ncbi:glycosyltransferase family 4 protein [Acholeplasma laidlawii]|uniref:glycosyltransferase family 4 protein n=1 Tax=Acholeplasma laidlawii TaxID=2148 RepID=UPI0018C22BCD|nr:glycosyltransferase family 4 protein [Acholeplasma laidlawii]MBG0763197.1 glycosyltransferase family 4 protein [Acholeplasma laidlawii]